MPDEAAGEPWGGPSGTAAELCVYRDRTVALLRRYLRMSLATGKMPNLLGRGEQFFRARVTSYKLHSFEDAVIFVYDVERCLGKLDAGSREILARVVLDEYSFDEAARVLRLSRRTLARSVPAAIDRLTLLLLERGMLQAFGFRKGERRESCQEGENGDFSACA